MCLGRLEAGSTPIRSYSFKSLSSFFRHEACGGGNLIKIHTDRCKSSSGGKRQCNVTVTGKDPVLDPNTSEWIVVNSARNYIGGRSRLRERQANVIVISKKKVLGWHSYLFGSSSAIFWKPRVQALLVSCSENLENLRGSFKRTSATLLNFRSDSSSWTKAYWKLLACLKTAKIQKMMPSIFSAMLSVHYTMTMQFAITGVTQFIFATLRRLAL